MLEPLLQDADLEPLRRDPEAVAAVERINQLETEQFSWAQSAVNNEAFVANVQFTREQQKALEARNQMAEAINVLLPAVDTTCALLTQGGVRYRTTGRETSDAKLNHIFNEILAYIFQNSEGQAVNHAVVWDYIVKGRGVYRVYEDFYADHGRGDLFMADEDPLAVYPDPNSKDPLWRDARDIMIHRLLTPSQIDEQWGRYLQDQFGLTTREFLRGAITRRGSRIPESTYVTGQFGSTKEAAAPLHSQAVETANDEYIELLEHFRRVSVMLYNVIDENGNEQYLQPDAYEEWRSTELAFLRDEMGSRTIDEPEKVLALKEMAVREGIEAAPGQFRVSTQTEFGPLDFEVRFATRGQLVASGELFAAQVQEKRIKLVVVAGGLLLYKRILNTSHYPVVPLQNRHHRNPYPDSDIKFARPMQLEINKLHMQILAWAAYAGGMKVFVPKGSDVAEIRRELSKSGISVMLYDPEMGAPVIGQPVPIGSEHYLQIDRLKQSIYELLGIWPWMQGEMQDAPDTFRATIQFEQNGQRRIRQRARKIERSLAQVGRVLVDMIPHMYTERRVLSIVESNNVERQTEINGLLYDTYQQAVIKINDVRAAKLDVIVIAGSTMPVNRHALAEHYIRLYEIGLADDVAVIKHLDIDDPEGLLERKSLYSQLQQTIQQLDAAVKQLSGDLQTAQRESIHAQMRVIVEKFKADLARTVNRADAAEKLYEQRLKDLFANEKQKQRQQAA